MILFRQPEGIAKASLQDNFQQGFADNDIKLI